MNGPLKMSPAKRLNFLSLSLPNYVKLFLSVLLNEFSFLHEGIHFSDHQSWQKRLCYQKNFKPILGKQFQANIFKDVLELSGIFYSRMWEWGRSMESA